MALVYGSTAFDAHTFLVSLAGTPAEIRAALAAGTGVDTGYMWRKRSQDIICSGGATTAIYLLYVTPGP